MQKSAVHVDNSPHAPPTTTAGLGARNETQRQEHETAMKGIEDRVLSAVAQMMAAAAAGLAGGPSGQAGTSSDAMGGANALLMGSDPSRTAS